MGTYERGGIGTVMVRGVNLGPLGHGKTESRLVLHFGYSKKGVVFQVRKL